MHSNLLVAIVALKCKYCHYTCFLKCCYQSPKPLYSTDPFSDKITCVSELVFSYAEDDAFVVFASDLNELHSDFLCYKYGLIEMVKTSTQDGIDCMGKVFTDRPDIHNYSFPMKSTLKTKHLAVLAFNGSRLLFVGIQTVESFCCMTPEVIILINSGT
jgi:hypothetical protein